MTGVRTPVPPLVCEFIIALSFRLPTQKKICTVDEIESIIKFILNLCRTLTISCL